ncbi:MAG: SIS domain-containing protein [Thauera sp.]|jgi:D-sedoheptulose 7-phosphate isomerase|nr:SIS domain-containing protein [Thauera sp.]
MDLVARLTTQIEASIRARQEVLEVLAGPLAGAIEALTACLLDNGRILVCADGEAQADAARMSRRLLHGFEHPRPALAGILIRNFAGDGSDDEETLARAVLALGHPADILLAIAPQPCSPQLIAALAAARERELRCIVLASEADSLLSELPGADDILLQLPAADGARSAELIPLILDCLCDGIDCLLLGVEH